MQPARYPVRWLLVSLAAMLCIAFFPYLFEGKIFLPTDMFDTMTAPFNAHYGPPQAQNFYPFDGIVQTYPYKVETQEALRRGHLAYWNPHILCGYPQYAETMGSNFDVFNVVGLWLDPWHTILAEVLLEFFVAGAGMCLLLRFFGVQPGVNLMFSAAYMLNSLFVASAMPRWAAASFCWMPFLVLMLMRYFQTGSKEDVIYASAFLALCFLGGNLQSAFFASLVVAALILVLPARPAKIDWAARLGIVTFVGILAFALSAMMWLPTIELLFQTLSRGMLNSSSVFSHYALIERALSIPLLLIFYFPNLAGSPELFNIKRLAGGDIMDFNGAITFVPALFAFWGCFALRAHKELRPFIGLAVAAILLPILTPLFTLLYHRVFVVATFSLSIIGAVACHSVLAQNELRRAFARFLKYATAAFGLLVLALIAICAIVAMNYDALSRKLAGMLLTKQPSMASGGGRGAWSYGRIAKTLDFYSFSSADLWLPILLGALSLLALALFFRGKLERRSTLALCFATTVISLVLFTRMWLPSIDPVKFPIYPPNSVAAFLSTHASGSRFLNWRNSDSDSYVLPSNASDAYHIDDFNGYESLTSPSMNVLYRRYIHNSTPDFRLLGLASVKYILTTTPMISSADLRPVFSADGVLIYENLLAKPRAFFAYTSRILASDTDIRKDLLRSDFDGSQALFESADEHPAAFESIPSANQVIVRKAGNEEIEIEAETASRGILILTDSYYPGWKCFVNGAPRPIYRVDGYLRGVMLEAGESVVLFRFEPGLFTAGIGLSGFAAAFALSAIGYLKRRRARNQRSEI